MKKILQEEWLFWLVLILPLITAFIIYPSMPQQVPIHWNWQGEIDRYSSRGFGTFFFPVFNIGMYLLLLIAPYIDPKKDNYHKFYGSYKLIRFTTHIFLTILYFLIVLVSLGYPLDMGFWVTVGVALLTIVIGNFISRVRHNYFLGFRFPWTLANEEVWRKTHLLGSKLMVLGGFGVLLSVFFTERAVRFTIVTLGILLPSLATFIYSYFLYNKLAKK